MAQPSKRQRINSDEYISVRKVWGPPPSKAPGKSKVERIEIEGERKKQRIEEKVVDGKQKETKIKENLEEYHDPIDWDIEIEEHKKELIKEIDDKKGKVELEKEKENTWELFQECKNFLESNERNWELRKLERETERKNLQSRQCTTATVTDECLTVRQQYQHYNHFIVTTAEQIKQTITAQCANVAYSVGRSAILKRSTF